MTRNVQQKISSIHARFNKKLKGKKYNFIFPIHSTSMSPHQVTEKEYIPGPHQKYHTPPFISPSSGRIQ